MKNIILYVLFSAALFSCQKKNDSASLKPCNKTGDSTKVKVGDLAHGGVVFYVDFTEKHGLVIGECYEWHLPSRDELLEIYRNLNKLSGVICSGGYQSSTLNDVNNKGELIVNKQQNFSDGTVGNIFLTDSQMLKKIIFESLFTPVRSF